MLGRDVEELGGEQRFVGPLRQPGEGQGHVTRPCAHELALGLPAVARTRERLRERLVEVVAEVDELDQGRVDELLSGAAEDVHGRVVEVDDPQVAPALVVLVSGRDVFDGEEHHAHERLGEVAAEEQLVGAHPVQQLVRLQGGDGQGEGDDRRAEQEELGRGPGAQHVLGALGDRGREGTPTLGGEQRRGDREHRELDGQTRMPSRSAAQVSATSGGSAMKRVPVGPNTDTVSADRASTWTVCSSDHRSNGWPRAGPRAAS